MLNSKKTLLNEASETSESSPDIVKADEKRGSVQCQPISQQIIYFIRFLALVCGLCWVAGVIVFLVVEVFQHDMAYTFSQSRPDVAQLTVLSCIGAITFLTGVLGYWGSLHLEHSMLFGFSYVIFMGSVIELCCGAVIISFKGSAIRENTLKLVKTEVKPTSYIFQIQYEFHCCGSMSPSDWLESAWWHAQRKENTSLVVPNSCCIHEPKDMQYKICNKGQPPYTSLDYPDLVQSKGCRKLLMTRRDALMNMCGFVFCIFGVFKLVAFFAIHYLVNIILSLQREVRQTSTTLQSSLNTN